MLRALCRDLRAQPPLLLANARVRSPFLAGLRRPAILLPAGYQAEFDPPALRAVLIHELTHLQRHDCAWNLLARVTGALLWVQPLLWVVRRRLEQAGEEICDQAVLQLEVNPRAYADCLLRLAERLLPSPPERAAGLGVVPFRSSLARRIEQIMDGSRRRSLHLAFRLRAAIAVGAACAVGVGLSFVSAAPSWRGAVKAHQPMNAPEKPAGGPVSGRVLTPDGQPAPRATVTWITHTDDGPVVLTSVKADANGQFRFEDTARLCHKNDYPQLLAEAAGAALTSRNLQEGSQTVDITFNPATEVRITFLDPNGKPVPDLKVLPELIAREREFIFLPEAIRQRLARQTDANGTVSFDGLPQGFKVRLDVQDERFAHVSDGEKFSLDNGPESEAQTIHLMPGASLQGRITFGPTG